MAKQTLYVLTDELQRVLDSLPPDERRCSSLEPFRAVILRWRRQGRTYRRICQILRDECHINVAYGTLHEFVQRRSKPRKVQPEIQPELASAAAIQPAATQRTTHSETTADPYAEARERMRQHKAAPLPSKPQKIFEVSEDELDPTKPLRMIPPNQR